MTEGRQVKKEHYNFSRYMFFGRWGSYFYQIREVLSTQGTKVLEVGGGDGVLGQYIKRSGISYTSVDIAEDLHPDVLGSVLQLPFEDNSFDTVCAFEVLEHIPFEDFERGIRELARVSRKHVLLSLPHFGPPISFSFKIPFLREIRFSWKFPFPKKHVFDGEHYWEIGKRGYSLSLVKELLEKHLLLKKDFIPFENQYHHFFILEKK